MTGRQGYALDLFALPPWSIFRSIDLSQHRNQCKRQLGLTASLAERKQFN